MSDCCGDYYVEAHIRGAPLKTVRQKMTDRGLYDPKSEDDRLETQDGGVHFISYSPGHDQYISDAFQLKEDVENALRELGDAQKKMYYKISLHIYKYEWIEV